MCQQRKPARGCMRFAMCEVSLQPDAKAYENNAAPSFGLVEINYTAICNITDMGRVKCVTGWENLKGNHKPYKQV